MKTKEELNAIKKEVEELNVKLSALSEEELAEVTGGVIPFIAQNLTDNEEKPRVLQTTLGKLWYYKD